MLYEKDLRNKGNSIYVCDACFCKITDPVKIHILNKPSFTIHLCMQCYYKSIKYTRGINIQNDKDKRNVL